METLSRPSPSLREIEKMRKSPENDTTSELGSALESGFSSSIDQEEAIVRLAQESQVLRAVIQETNGRHATALDEIEELKKQLECEKERNNKMQSSIDRLERGISPQQKKTNGGGLVGALLRILCGDKN